MLIRVEEQTIIHGLKYEGEKAKESAELHKRQRKDSERKRTLKKSRLRPFIAYDGEGYTTADGKHVYALFGNSLGQRISGNLCWRQVLPLLFAAPKEANHVIYSGTYDVVMLFRRELQIQMLLRGKVVNLDQYRIHYLRGKMLRITDRELKQTRTLYDVFTFFGGSFVKACTEYLGSSELLDEIQAMKLQRNTFTAAEIDGSVNDYMTQELQLLVTLCETLRERLAAVNIHPVQWHGPGAVASAVLKDHKIKENKGNYEQEFRTVAESAYYGGRFEQFARGSYEGKVWQYDIRSAYPDAMRELPDLASTVWQHRVGPPASVDMHGLYYVDYRNAGANPFDIGRLPHRSKKGSIYYPTTFSIGWYWGVEVTPELATCVTEYYRPYTSNPVKPFAFVADMYEQRALLKKQGKPEQLALKLALNSLYGKLAQSKGARHEGNVWLYPTFHEIVWAGLITAYARNKINNALHSVPKENIIATETDSIFSLTPLDLELGEGLGCWDLEILEGIKYIQSGISLVKKGGKWTFKSRGFTVKKSENEVEIWSQFLAMKEPCLQVKQTRFGTDPRALRTFSTWYETLYQLRLDNNPLEKRTHNYCPNCETGLGYADTLHRLAVPPLTPAPSTPYEFVWNSDPSELIAELGYDEPLLKMEYI